PTPRSGASTPSVSGTAGRQANATSTPSWISSLACSPSARGPSRGVAPCRLRDRCCRGCDARRIRSDLGPVARLSTAQNAFGPRGTVRVVTTTLVRGETEVTDAPPSLTSRLLTPKTIAPLGIAVVIVGVGLWRAQIDWGAAWDNIRHANPFLYLGALAVYYASFVVRSVRWHVLLGNAGEERPAGSLVGIVITSFFVNCVVPAKMGDIYRGYLAKQRLEVPVSKALGTIIAERLIDLIVLMSLLLAAGAVVFRTKAPGILIPYVVIGVLVCLAGVGVILVMRAGRGQRILRLLPEAVFQRYESLRLGTVNSFARLPTLLVLTAMVW